MWGYKLNENGTFKTYGQANVEDPSSTRPTSTAKRRSTSCAPAPARSSRSTSASRSSLRTAKAGRESGTEGPIVRAAPRYRKPLRQRPAPARPAFDEANLSDKPSFLAKAFPPMTADWIKYSENSYRSRLAAAAGGRRRGQGDRRRAQGHRELDNTLIIFMSDNGFFYGEHRIPFGKYMPTSRRSACRLLIAAVPVSKPDATSKALVMNTDIAATVVDAAGARAGRKLDGRSLLPFAADPKKLSQRPICSRPPSATTTATSTRTCLAAAARRARRAALQGVRTSANVYIEWASGDQELYDLQRDPNELQSRAADTTYAKTKAALVKDVALLSSARAPPAVSTASRPRADWLMRRLIATVALLGAAGAASAAPGSALAAARCPSPPAAAYPDTDGARDARSGDPLFRRVAVPGFTDQRKDTLGPLSRTSTATGSPTCSRSTTTARCGCCSAKAACASRPPLPDRRLRATATTTRRAAPAIANWADLNGDGYLDAFISQKTTTAPTRRNAARQPSGGHCLR